MKQSLTERPNPAESSQGASSLAGATGSAKHESTVVSRPGLPGEPEPDVAVIPGYTILEQLGQGGMGQVFKARQERLDRIVALKVIRQDRQDTEAVRRFQREAQAAAKLSHPNIVIVHDFDQVGDNCFIAMEYVEGTDLYHMVKEEGPLPPPRACDYVRQVALGLQHAHERGLVHRDIKPANLLVAGVQLGASQKAADSPPGVVKILDMGMALLQGVGKDSVHVGADGGLMGTPDYMAPEQAMDFRQVDIRADLYSLGCTFYYLLTGRPPFDEYPLMRKMMMHQQGTVRPVWELRSSIPPEIDAIVQKLLAKKPENRYQTPAELIDAVSALLEGEKQPEKKGVVEGDKAQARGDSQSLIFQLPAEPASTKAPSSITRTRSSPARAESPDRGPVTPSKDDLAETFSKDRLTAALSEARPADEPPAPESGEPRRGPGAPKKMAVLQGPAGGASVLAFGPKRDVLAAGGLQGALRFWEFHGAPRERIIVQTFETGVWSLAFSPDQRGLAWGSGSVDGLVCLGDLTDPTLNRMALLHRHQAPVDAVTFSADGKMLATGSRDQTLRWWELVQTESGLAESPKEPTVFKGHKGEITSVAFSPDGKTLASASKDGTVRLWKRGGFWSKEKATLDGKWGSVQAVAFAPLAPVLAFGCQDQTIRLFAADGSAPKEAAVLQGHEGAVRTLLFPPEGQTLVSICDKGVAILWDLASGAETHRWPLDQLTGGVAFTVDGRYIALGSAEGVVKVLRLFSKKSK
jgi:serine/threonine protein kinase